MAKQSEHRRWAERPADERFRDAAEMRAAAKAADEARRTTVVEQGSLVVDERLRLRVGGAGWAELTHWSFGQLCRRADVPAYYLRTMSAELASRNLNYGLRERATPADRRKPVRVCLRGKLVETFTSEDFQFIPHWKVCDGIAILGKSGWKVEGLFASDHDMHAFLVSDEAAVDDGSGRAPLQRGAMLSNSEVSGSVAFKITSFLYDTVSGGHIVYGARDVVLTRVRHIGDGAAEQAFRAIGEDLSRGWGSPADAKHVARMIKEARRKVLGSTVDEIAERLVCEKRLYLGRADAVKAYRLAEEHDADRVDPRSVWGIILGLTRLSQEEPHADERVLLDRTAGGLMRLVDPTARCGIQRPGGKEAA